MTAQSSRRITCLINTFADWLKHRRELNQVRQLDRFEFDRIAADLEISSSELEELVRRGLHAADELPLLLKALGIDEAALARTDPLVLRDMERVCTLCRHKARCDMDLADATSAEYFSSYCPNESTIKQLERTAAAPMGRRLLSSHDSTASTATPIAAKTTAPAMARRTRSSLVDRPTIGAASVTRSSTR